MGVIATIRDFLAPLSHSAREHRQENMTVADVNKAAARELLAAERAYWTNYMRRAATHGDLEYGMDKLEELDRIERAS